VPAGQVEEILALTIVFTVHVVGGLLLVWGVLGDEGRGAWRRWWRRGGDDGDRPVPPQPSPPGERLPWPLPDAQASRVRLREGGRRAADGYPSPARRHEHEPPAPAPSRRESG